MTHKYIIVRKEEIITEPFNGKIFDRYSEPKYYDSIKQAAEVIQIKRLIYTGMSGLVGIRKVRID